MHAVKTIYVVHCITGPDSAWFDRDKADIRAAAIDYRVAAVPMPDDGEELALPNEAVLERRPPGYDGGGVVSIGAGGGGSTLPSGMTAMAFGGGGSGGFIEHPQQWSEKLSGEK